MIDSSLKPSRDNVLPISLSLTAGTLFLNSLYTPGMKHAACSDFAELFPGGCVADGRFGPLGRPRLPLFARARLRTQLTALHRQSQRN